MNCNNRISASAMLMAASLAFSPAAWSLGLGEVKVESYLNQPLKARIDLISQASDDLTGLTARMASADDYELIGASIKGIPVPIRFTVEDIGGDAYISATSNLPISEPVLRLIVEVNWSSGRMLREYTLFLDPPAVPEAAPAPRIEQRKVPPPPAAAGPAPSAAPSAAHPTAPTAAPSAAATPPVSPAPATRRAGAADAEYGPVRSGETLWGIASEWSRGSGLNVNQVMIAIQRENPNAFLNDNINLLKRGAILRMPDVAQVEEISAAAAYREVATQSEEFKDRTARSVASPATPLLSDESAALPDEGAGGAEAEEEPAAPAVEAAAPAEPSAAPGSEDASDIATEAADTAAADEGQDLLELVPPSADSKLESGYGFEGADQPVEISEDVDALRENLARTEEELINQQQQNSYLEDRIRELESELASAGEGRVDDAALASTEARLRDERQAAAQKPESSEPWYSRLSFWMIGLLVMVAALAGWLLSRRGQARHAAAEAEESLRSIQSEAEDVLRVLADDADPAAADTTEPERPQAEAGAGEESGSGDEPEGVSEPAEARPLAASDDNAELLDEDSSDPEIQLDLARAYISMGDKEAARVILDEVIANGTGEQRAEAEKMLGFL